MAKRVQLVLREEVRKLGKSGDLVEVAPGYARNYLIPQGVAVLATPGVLKQAERRRQQEEERQLALKELAISHKSTLEALTTLTVAKQAGEKESLFGTVTEREVAALIQELTGIEVDRRLVTLPEIHKLGNYTAQIKLHSQVVAEVQVQVVAAN